MSAPSRPLSGTRRHDRIALGLVLAGLCAFAAAHLAFRDEPAPPPGYETAGDAAYPADPLHSKAFLAAMERAQGKSGVALYEFGLWWDGLWRGRALGRTLLVVSVLAALAVAAWARLFPPLDPDPADKTPAGPAGRVPSLTSGEPDAPRRTPGKEPPA